MRSKSSPDNSALHIDIIRLTRIKGISEPYSFLTANGFTDHTAKQYTTGRVQRPDLRDLLKLCRIFGCALPDLFRLDQAAGSTLAPGDPLASLVRPATEPDLHKLLRELPLDQVRKIADNLAAGTGAQD